MKLSTEELAAELAPGVASACTHVAVGPEDARAAVTAVLSALAERRLWWSVNVLPLSTDMRIEFARLHQHLRVAIEAATEGKASAVWIGLDAAEKLLAATSPSEPSTQFVDEIKGRIIDGMFGIIDGTITEINEHGEKAARSVLSALASLGAAEARRALPTADQIWGEFYRPGGEPDAPSARVLALCTARLAPILAAKDARIVELSERVAYLEDEHARVERAALASKAACARMETERDEALNRASALEADLASQRNEHATTRHRVAELEDAIRAHAAADSAYEKARDRYIDASDATVTVSIHLAEARDAADDAAFDALKRMRAMVTPHPGTTQDRNT